MRSHRRRTFSLVAARGGIFMKNHTPLGAKVQLRFFAFAEISLTQSAARGGLYPGRQVWTGTGELSKKKPRQIRRGSVLMRA